MIDKYYIGIDGGGTYTKAVAYSPADNILFRVKGETINFNSVGIACARKNIEDVFDRITKKIPEDNIASVFIGCSALDGKADAKTVKDLMGKYSHLDVEINSDIYIALYGHSFGNRGAMLISGTGSMGIAIDPFGETHICGGWGFAIGDEGSAYYIAAEGLKTVSRMADGREEKSMLLDCALDFYRVDAPYRIIDQIYTPAFSRSEIARFAVKVAECAENGDTAALSILDNAAYELARIASVLLRQADISDSLAVYGGVFQNNQYVFSKTEELLRKQYPNIKLTFPRLSPEFAALLAAIDMREKLGEKFEEILEKLSDMEKEKL